MDVKVKVKYIDGTTEELKMDKDAIKKGKNNNEFKKLLKKSGLSQTAFAKEFGIPLRTIQNWMAGVRKPADYVENLINYKLEQFGKNIVKIVYYVAEGRNGGDEFGEYYDSLEEASKAFPDELDKTIDYAYMYKTALAEDEYGEWSQDGAIAKGWDGDYYASYNPIMELKK